MATLGSLSLVSRGFAALPDSRARDANALSRLPLHLPPPASQDEESHKGAGVLSSQHLPFSVQVNNNAHLTPCLYRCLQRVLLQICSAAIARAQGAPAPIATQSGFRKHVVPGEQRCAALPEQRDNAWLPECKCSGAFRLQLHSSCCLSGIILGLGASTPAIHRDADLRQDC